MPNKAAKDRKRKKRLLNKRLAKEGRTAKQHKKWLASDASKTTNNPYGRLR